MPGGVFPHPSLGHTLRGEVLGTTVQYRNLKYASIPARYKDSILNETLRPGPDGVVDATQFGPSCPHLRGAQAWDLTLVGNIQIPCEHGQGENERMDEFDCLHITVTIPKTAATEARRDGSGLPVFVWVHGGGLSMGSNSWPQYDLRKFVERSVAIGKPVIGVSMNYRHGIFGFLASKDVGAAGNMGYKDQMLAFRWIKKHIAGFGGDCNSITAVGESAGAISLSTLLCADVGREGLFERVIIMSGEATLRKPRSRWWHQRMCIDQSKYFGLDEKDTDERGKLLLETEAEEIAQKLPLAQHFSGLIDGKWLKENFTLHTLKDGESSEHKPDWCKEYVIGDTAHDGTVLKGRILDHPKALARLKIACETHLSSTEAHGFLTTYKLDGTPTPAEEATRLREIASELRFYYPALAAYRGWKACVPPKRAARYHFHVQNPVDGPYKGLASHELDVTYLLQNFNDQFDSNNQKIAQEMADQFIRFTSGEGWVEDGKLIVFGRDGLLEVDEDKYDQVYREGRGSILESIDAKKLWNLAEAWHGVRKDDEDANALLRDAKL